MARKGGPLYSSTPSRVEVKNFFENKPPSAIVSPVNHSDMNIVSESTKVNVIKKETILDLVVDAIGFVGVPKKGASYQAIKKWIIDKKGGDSHLKYYLKLALKKGIEQGILLRPRSSENAVGITGFFMLALKPPKSPKKIATKKILKKVPSAGKVKQADKKTSNIPPNIKVVPMKAAAKTNTATKTLKAKIEKKPTKKAVSQPKGEKNLTEGTAVKPKRGRKPVSPKVAPKNTEDNTKKITEDFEFGEADEVISKVAKAKAKTKPPAKNKAVKNNTGKMELQKAESAPVKGKKGKAAKETKKLANPDINSNEQTNMTQIVAKGAGNQKRNESEEELEQQEVPDSVFSGNEEFLFNNSQSDEDPVNEAPKATKRKANAKQTAKNKTIKNTEKLELLNAENAPSVKDKKGKVVKETKKLATPGVNSNNQTNIKQRIAKTAGHKKGYASENELEVQDFESELATKKHKAFKSFSSDTELEVSKKEERKNKKPLRVRKNISKS